MNNRIAAGAAALALGLGIASCSTDTPTAPNAASTSAVAAPQTGQADRTAPKSRGQTLSFPVAGSLATDAGVAAGSFTGTFNVTRFGFDEATHKLMVTGVLNGTATFLDAARAPETITNLTVTFPATLARETETASTSTGSTYQFAAATCGILLLDLGPLHLDLLGLVLDLNEVILDLTAQTGANNLLGNLLCALTGLFDIPGAIAGIINLLNAINNLLSGIGGLATPAGLAPFGGLDISHGAITLLRSA